MHLFQPGAWKPEKQIEMRNLVFFTNNIKYIVATHPSSSHKLYGLAKSYTDWQHPQLLKITEKRSHLNGCSHCSADHFPPGSYDFDNWFLSRVVPTGMSHVWSASKDISTDTDMLATIEDFLLKNANCSNADPECSKSNLTGQVSQKYRGHFV